VTVLAATEKGAHTELLFCAEAGARGYTIFTPLVGSPKADVCLKMGQGPYVGIQVKRACTSTQRAGLYKINTSSRSKKYSAGDFDILAAYLPDLNVFVFWRLDEIAKYGQISYSPERHRDPDNWELLNDAAESLTFSGSRTADV
jgi:hypothetical protein